MDRISSFYQSHNLSDDQETINNTKVSRLDKLISDIDWDFMSDGIPSRIHGDFHFENIIYTSKKNLNLLTGAKILGVLLSMVIFIMILQNFIMV